ncbi:hypothetical protein DFP72DRAFT_31366 [Ephemerocybe angulata]|uniref:BTB domain-containing protein n=1 Tax=Ephemerocybe angulata TaxID=980116 RepID=A0A8H6IB64_9AGAR|nr:hypothetical protein DFP72DRAFT_31366 [Tulosesus angulatus]
MNADSAFPTDAGTMTAMTEPAGEKDDVYYWPDNVTFSIDGKLFRVSRYQFIVGSEHFSATYGLAEDKDIVHLEGITHAQFRTFLKILFPMCVSFNQLDCNLSYLTEFVYATVTQRRRPPASPKRSGSPSWSSPSSGTSTSSETSPSRTSKASSPSWSSSKLDEQRSYPAGFSRGIWPS